MVLLRACRHRWLKPTYPLSYIFFLTKTQEWKDCYVHRNIGIRESNAKYKTGMKELSHNRKGIKSIHPNWHFKVAETWPLVLPICAQQSISVASGICGWNLWQKKEEQKSEPTWFKFEENTDYISIKIDSSNWTNMVQIWSKNGLHLYRNW